MMATDQAHAAPLDSTETTNVFVDPHVLFSIAQVCGLAFWAFVCYVTVCIVYARHLHPLRNIPGPFLASITRFWSVWQVTRGNYETTQRRLHARYGPLVRSAPDEVACADPAAIKIIYSVQRIFPKTNFYFPFKPVRPQKYSGHFAELNEKQHSQRRRIVNPVYSMSTILESEKYVDKCSKLFVSRMAEVAGNDCYVDLGHWLQMWVLRFSSQWEEANALANPGTLSMSLASCFSETCSASCLRAKTSTRISSPLTPSFPCSQQLAHVQASFRSS